MIFIMIIIIKMYKSLSVISQNFQATTAMKNSKQSKLGALLLLLFIIDEVT